MEETNRYKKADHYLRSRGIRLKYITTTLLIGSQVITKGSLLYKGIDKVSDFIQGKNKTESPIETSINEEIKLLNPREPIFNMDGTLMDYNKKIPQTYIYKEYQETPKLEERKENLFD